ncbi:MAG: filamentous hemagglutinin N-terminal domain-containing protein [Leptolyngbya sp. RL_3_1]|nr:filamentous hemagglutinin N-terminal domain-containing protein [Leptolyngbya sp. RL_3_1]
MFKGREIYFDQAAAHLPNMFDRRCPWNLPLAQLIGIGYWLLSVPALAQGTDIQPDVSLPNPSTVGGAGTVVITGGTQDQSGNLFHSFSRFSVGAGDTAFFDLGVGVADIDNVITRVTGGVASVIDGQIQVNGTANLFLINPNGITFGPNATLSLGGSFFGNTAESLVFPQFSYGTVDTTVPSNLPTLTVNIPLGLQYGSNPGEIVVNGPGNALFVDRFTFEIVRDFRPDGLVVDIGETLALLGGNVRLTGGNITAPQGQIDLGAVGANSFVELMARGSSWALDYGSVANFGAIALSDAASADVSGAGGGNVQVYGRTLSLTDGSAILSNTLGTGTGGQVTVQTLEAWLPPGPR